MSINAFANTVFFSGRFRAELATAMAEEEQRKSEPSYHFDNAFEAFSEFAVEAAEDMLDELRKDVPEVPRRARLPKMNSEQMARRLLVLDHLFGNNQVVAVNKST